MARYACGIDFGTTNSTIGITVSTENDVRMVAVEQDHITLPTALFFPLQKGNFIPFIGRDAVSRYVHGEEGRFIRSIKRILGTDLMDKYTFINDRPILFGDIIQKFLKHLKQRAESVAGAEIVSVVMGRPVHFQDNDPNADQAAQDKLASMAQAVGFRDVAFQYEPIAAAFAHEQNLDREQLACVIDIGGGTSDFTIIRIGADHKKKQDRSDDVLGSSGIRIGGNDFDRDLSLESFMPVFGKGSLYGRKNLTVPSFIYSDLSEWSKINFTYTQKNMEMVEEIFLTSKEPAQIERLFNLLQNEEAHHLLNVVEESKIQLTDVSAAQAFFNTMNERLTFDVDRSSFERAIFPDVQKVKDNMNELLAQAQIASSQIDLVVLTGGSCEIPLVRQTILDCFLDAIVSETNKMSSVGLGLTYFAKSFYGV